VSEYLSTSGVRDDKRVALHKVRDVGANRASEVAVLSDAEPLAKTLLQRCEVNVLSEGWFYVVGGEREG
jgi:hypothetical protein